MYLIVKFSLLLKNNPSLYLTTGDRYTPSQAQKLLTQTETHSHHLIGPIGLSHLACHWPHEKTTYKTPIYQTIYKTQEHSTHI